MKAISLKNKRILLTGSHGFVGSHLFERLAQEGAKVFGVSRTRESPFTLKSTIADFIQVDEYIKKNNIEICVHLAGEALVEEGQRDPYNTYKTNILGTLNVLESSRKNNLERIVIASTVHVYGKNRVPYFETYVPKPSRSYETSKACADLIAQSYATTFNLPILIPRFVNIYGPGDLNFTRLIPKTIKSILRNSLPEMWGGEAMRDYLYIEDALDAYLKLLTVPLEKIKGNRVINFGSSNKSSVEEVIEKILAVSGSNLEIRKVKEERPLEIPEQYVSFAKAKRLLGWNPSVDLSQGLKKTFEWYKRNSHVL